MTESSIIEYWWLIPLILMLFCIFGAPGCCAGWSRRRERWPQTGRSDHNDTALAILNRRYAKGEIDDEEYVNKREVLNGAGKGDG